jgi:hypothetical protein
MLVLCLTLLISLTVRWLMRGVFGIPDFDHVLWEFGDWSQEITRTLYINISLNHAICIVHKHNLISILVFHF